MPAAPCARRVRVRVTVRVRVRVRLRVRVRVRARVRVRVRVRVSHACSAMCVEDTGASSPPCTGCPPAA